LFSSIFRTSFFSSYHLARPYTTYLSVLIYVYILTPRGDDDTRAILHRYRCSESAAAAASHSRERNVTQTACTRAGRPPLRANTHAPHAAAARPARTFYERGLRRTRSREPPPFPFIHNRSGAPSPSRAPRVANNIPVTRPQENRHRVRLWRLLFLCTRPFFARKSFERFPSCSVEHAQ